MHISEGILAGTSQGQALLLAGGASAAVGTAIGLWKIDHERIPQVALLSAAFFVASLVHVPLGPTVEHLVLSGLLGLVLGWAAFPAVLVALVLQAVFFSYGGLTTLGVNTVVMALPGVACHYLFRGAARRDGEAVVFAAGFAAGAVAILLGGLLQASALAAAGESFRLLGRIVFALHLPVALVEGLVTGSVVVFLRRVRPELLGAAGLLPTKSEFCDG
jgi:cobalt/nickel transport system permease protein